MYISAENFSSNYATCPEAAYPFYRRHISILFLGKMLMMGCSQQLVAILSLKSHPPLE